MLTSSYFHLNKKHHSRNIYHLNQQEMESKYSRHVMQNLSPSQRPTCTGKTGTVHNVYQKNTTVFLLSSMHHDKILMEPKAKSEMIQFRKDTKLPVDTKDKLLEHYTKHRYTTTLPLGFVFNILALRSTCYLHCTYCN